MPKNIIVTGCAGFLGTHLTQELLGFGHNVLGIDSLEGGFRRNLYDHKKFEFIHADLADMDGAEIRAFQPDIMFHMAADATEGRSQFTPYTSTKNNILASVNAFRHAINAGVRRIVFASSMSRYGAQEPPFSEDMEPKPVDVYGVNKFATESILRILAKVHLFEWTILVPHNLFGPRQNISDPYRNVVGIFVNRIMQGKPPIIYGDGEQTRAFTYVGNFTPFCMHAGFLDEAGQEVINIGPTQEYSINHLARTLLEMMGSDLEPVYYPDRPLEVKHAYCTVDKAREILMYETLVSFEDGLQHMVDWAGVLGPQPMQYLDDLEIVNARTPKTWSNMEM